MSMNPAFMERLITNIPKIRSAHTTPFCVYDEEGIVDSCRSLAHAYSCVPGFKQFFPVRALSDPAILRIMHTHGFGFKCSTIHEVILAKQAGAKPSEIYFYSNNMSSQEYVYVQNAECGIIFDDADMLYERFIQKRIAKTVTFRINPSVFLPWSTMIHPNSAVKHGIAFDQIVPAYQHALKCGATQFGLYAQFVTNDTDYAHFVTTVESLLHATSILKKELGICVKFINVGGGIGVAHYNDDPRCDIATLASKTSSLLSHFQEEHGFSPHVHTEYGSLLVGEHGCLISEVIRRKNTSIPRINLHVNIPTVCGNDRPISVHDYTGKIALNRARELITIGGIVCERSDSFATQYVLPRVHVDPINPEYNDLIFIHNMGAYGTDCVTQSANESNVTGLLLQHDGTISITRRATCLTDLDYPILSL